MSSSEVLLSDQLWTNIESSDFLVLRILERDYVPVVVSLRDLHLNKVSKLKKKSIQQ